MARLATGLAVSLPIFLMAISVAGCGGALGPDGLASRLGASARPADCVWMFDFGEGPLEEGYRRDVGKQPFTEEAGYGWTDLPDHVRDRGMTDALRRDFIFSRKSAAFRVKLDPGIYRLTFIAGDMIFNDHFLTVHIPEVLFSSETMNPKQGEFATLTLAIPVEGPYLDIRFDSPVNNWVVNALTICKADAPEAASIAWEREEIVRTEPVDMWQDVFAWPDPVAPYVETFRRDARTFGDVEPTGLSRADYLRLIEGNVRYFQELQNEDGAIIDPFMNVEWQYSTPCYALAAALLIVHEGREDLIESAAKAMDWSAWTLSQRKAATAHEDFYPPQLAHALPLLKPYVTPARYAKWEADIRGFDPYMTYRSACGHGNWNVVALSGEALFYLMGLRETPNFTIDCLAGQGRLFNNPWGLYTEGPMPYDHFPRIWAADMLAAGFTGPNTDKLAEVLRRGALTSLFLQSPTGELPTGGRSAHHQWNEAEQCLTFEIYAAKALEEGDAFLAGVFKRAARLSLESMRRWQRPSGEMWIVKNRAHPSKRLGYEGYSAHSQYNLLAMAMLAIAFQHAEATEHVAEQPAPADVGGFVVHLGAPFHKIFANAGGQYVQIDHAADLAFNATGLIRTHRTGINSQLGPSDGLSAYSAYQVPVRSRATAAVGAAWKDSSGDWRSLAEFGLSRNRFDHRPQVALSEVVESPEGVTFTVTYEADFDGPARVIERYSVTPDGVDLTVELEDYSGPMRMVWPVLASDGLESSRIEVKAGGVEVRFRGDIQTFEPVGAESVRVETERHASRNGWSRVAIAEYPNAQMALLRIRSGIGDNR